MTGMMVTGIFMTGIPRTTGVIQTRHTWCHTDIQTDWYAGITDALIFQPLPLGCVVIDLILFIVLFVTYYFCLYKKKPSHRQLLFIPVITFVYRICHTSY